MTTTAVEQHGDTVLAITNDQIRFTPQQQKAITEMAGLRDVPAAQMAVFFHHCKRTGLDPFARQIYLVGRYSKRNQSTQYSIQTGIDGYRVMAHRTGEMAGTEGPFWCGKDGQWRDVWLTDDKPLAAKYIVHRKGHAHSYVGVAKWSEFGQQQSMWNQMPAHMLAKVAESHALRKAFPEDLSGVYTEDEMPTSTDTHDAPVATVTVLPNDNDAQEEAEALQEAVEDRDAEFGRLRTKFMAQIGDLGFAYAVDVKPWLLETYEVESFNDLGLEEVRALTSALDKDGKRAGFSKRITDFRLANAPDDDVEDAEVVEEDGEESIKARVERLGLKKVDVIAKANELAVGLKATKPTAYMKDWREGGMHPGLFAAIVSWLDEVEEGAK